MDRNNKSNTGLAVGLLIVGLIVGGLVVGLIVHSRDSSKLASATTPSSSTKAADLRSGLVTLGVEHMTLTDQAVAAALDGSTDAKAIGAALYANGDTIGASVGSVYGTSAQTTFDSVWKLHLDQFVNYAVADKTGDAAAKQAALDTIQSQYTLPLSKFLANANPNFSQSTIQTSLSMHVNMTAQVIDDHVKGDYTKEAADLTAANSHIADLFSYLASGIVKQYPSKF
jgi:hypothetical protein